MIKKTSSNQPCGRDSEYITGAFLKSFSIFYTTHIGVALAHHEVFRAKVGKGGIKVITP